MILFALEPLSVILPEVEELWRLHWQETEGYRDVQGYAPDIAQFMQMDKLGWFAEYTARDNGRLVGHLGFIVHNSRHSRHRMSATEDFFYLRREYRRGMTAMQLLRFAVKSLKERGCSAIGMSSKLTNDISPLLKRAGFSQCASMWMMNVEENL